MSGITRAIVSASSEVLPSSEKSGLGRPARLSGQKRVPRPPAIISAAARSFARGGMRGGVPAQSNLSAELLKLALEERSNLAERLLVVRLEPQHECRLRIGRAHEPPSAGEIDARAVDIDRLIMRPEIFGGLAHDLELVVVGTIDANFGRRVSARQIGEDGGEAPALLPKDLEQTKGGVNRVVEAVVAVVEKHVAAHLARERRVFLLELALDQ